MNCPICRNGQLNCGLTTLVFEKNNSTVVIKKVPANVCENCGEKFIDENVSKKVHSIATTEFKKGIEIEILNFAA